MPVSRGSDLQLGRDGTLGRSAAGLPPIPGSLWTEGPVRLRHRFSYSLASILQDSPLVVKGEVEEIHAFPRAEPKLTHTGRGIRCGSRFRRTALRRSRRPFGQPPYRSNTSWNVGMEHCAPLRVTVIAAALFANCSASPTVFPPARPAANAPQNVSPAAVVSTAFTGTPSIQTISPLVVWQYPFAPSVRTTSLIPISSSRLLPAARESLPSMENSVSLSTSISQQGRYSLTITFMGAGFKITYIPRRRAAFMAYPTASTGFSSWHRKRSPSPARSKSRSASSAVTRPLAPPSRMMRLSPSVTRMTAMPLEQSGTARIAPVFTPQPFSPSTRASPKLSAPTAPPM